MGVVPDTPEGPEGDVYPAIVGNPTPRISTAQGSYREENERRTQALLLVRALPAHVYRALACLLERADELEEALVAEAHLGLGAVGEAALGRGADVDDEVVLSEERLFEFGGENGGEGDGEGVEGG